MKTEDAVAMFARWAQDERCRRDRLQRGMHITFTTACLSLTLLILSLIFIEGRTPLEWFMQGVVVAWWFVVAGVLSRWVQHSSSVILRYDNAAVLVAHGHVP